MRFRDPTQSIPLDDNSSGLRVIAAGQWRCATSSLQLAFERILDPPFAPSMHGAYLMPSPAKLRKAVLCQRLVSSVERQKVLKELFTGYNASSDWPGFAFVDDLLDLYPDCKVVLNTRSSAHAWEGSVRGSLRFYSTYTYRLLTFWSPQSYWHYRLYRGYMKLAKQRHDTDDIFSAECYERHRLWVHKVAAGRGIPVLEWEPSQGWKPLCQFLAVDVPDELFPRMNEAAELSKLKVALLKRGLLQWSVTVIVLCLIAASLMLVKSKVAT